MYAAALNTTSNRPHHPWRRPLDGPLPPSGFTKKSRILYFVPANKERPLYVSRDTMQSFSTPCRFQTRVNTSPTSRHKSTNSVLINYYHPFALYIHSSWVCLPISLSTVCQHLLLDLVGSHHSKGKSSNRLSEEAFSEDVHRCFDWRMTLRWCGFLDP